MVHRGALLGVVFALGGCKEISEVLKKATGAELPTAGLARVDLVQQPTTNDLLAWSCHDYLDSTTCSLVGYPDKPRKNKMKFGFDVVFDLLNPNYAFAIPLVELLLGIDVLQGTNLGMMCVSFCDPDDAECTAATDAEDACNLDEAEELDEPKDLVPTVDDLIELGTDLSDGALDENMDFRVIPKAADDMCHSKGTTCTEEEVDGVLSMCCDGECEPLATGCVVGKNDDGKTCALCEGHMEAHIRVDFAIDTMLDLLETLFEKAADDLLNGRAVSLDIPYSVNGNLFFDVPKMGRYVLGFGPFDETWKVI